MPRKVHHPVFAVLLFLAIMYAAPANALELTYDTGAKFDKIRKHVLDNVSRLAGEPRLLREEAKSRKMKMALEYDEFFEEHKAEIRRIGERISQLSELEDNFKNIEYLKQQKILKSKILANKIEDFRTSYAGVYIPVVMAGYIEVPPEKDELKSDMLQEELSQLIMDEFSIERIWTEKIVRENLLVEEEIITRRIGTIELDGTKSFDRNFLNYTPDGTRFLSLFFYRFKPFEAPRNDTTTTRGSEGLSSDSEGTSRIESWNLSRPGDVINLKSFIASRFPNEAGTYQRELVGYLESLKNLQGRIDKGRQRAEEVIARLNRLLLKGQADMSFIDENIRLLENQNATILANFDAAPDVGPHNVAIEKEKLIRQKKELEDAFEYGFILMGESSASSFEQSLRNAIEDMFTKLKSLSKKKSVDITTTVSSGIMLGQGTTVSSFSESFSNVAIYPYVEGSTVGALMSVSVRYDRFDGNSSNVRSVSYDGDFTESTGDIGINMKFIEDPTGAAGYFFISKMPITKSQFAHFAGDLASHMDTGCLARLGDEKYFLGYPGHFPVLCVSSEGRSAFVEWLRTSTGKQYELPTENQKSVSGAYGLNDSSDDVFRVVLSH